MNRPTISESSLNFQLVLPNVVAVNQKQAMRAIAHDAAKLTGMKDRILAERLLDIEKENSSAMGDGVALSQLRVSGLKEALNIFVRFKNPVPFGTSDKKDVELFCLLITPEREGSAYLRTMARASRLLRNKQMRADLKDAKSAESIRAVLEQSSLELKAA